MINLTPEERRKFVEYLKQEAASCDALVGQLEKSGGIAVPSMQVLAKIQRTEAAAYLFVATKLEGWEQQTIKG